MLEWVMLFTVKVTLLTRDLDRFLRIEHCPLELVTQEALPVVPPLQLPLTVAFETAWWLALWTVMVTVARQKLVVRLELAPVKLPRCMLDDGAGVGVAVGVGVGPGGGAEPRAAAASNTPPVTVILVIDETRRTLFKIASRAC